MAYRPNKRKAEEMSSHNVSSVDKTQQWRNELQMQPLDPAPMPIQEIFKDAAQQKHPSSVMAGATVCCEQANCNRTRIEPMPEHLFRDPTAPFTMVNPDGRDPQSGKRDNSAPPAEYMDPICSFCGINRGQLVTICCTGRDCDNSTKIDEVMAPPLEEKRHKDSYNQFKY